MCVCPDITDVYVSLCAANVEIYVPMFHVWKLIVTFHFSLTSNKLLSVVTITPLFAGFPCITISTSPVFFFLTPGDAQSMA